MKRMDLKKTDALFHVERAWPAAPDEFHEGDLVLYNGTPATIVGIPETVMGHYLETPQGGLICLDLCTILIDGNIKNVETEKIFHLRCPPVSK